MGPLSFICGELLLRPAWYDFTWTRFYHKGGESLEQIAHRGSRGLIPGNIQGQAGWSSEQPGLVEDNPAHCRD